MAMGTIPADLRLGFRLLFNRPGFTAVAVLTLALGIGVTTAMFSVLNTMYWKAFPGAADPGRLVELETVAPDGSIVKGSWLDFRQFRDHLRKTAVASHNDVVLTLGGPDHPRPVWGEVVSGNYFAVLGVKPAFGRVFSTAEYTDAPGAHPVAVISHRLWADEFQRSANVLGKTLRVNRRNLTVIGVAPPEFRGAMAGVQSDLWIPLTMGLDLGVVEPGAYRESGIRTIYMFGRLGPGVELPEARAELAALAGRLAALDPAGHRGFGATLEPIWRSRIHGRARSLETMLILAGVSVLILVIVCANVANLLLARSVGRLPEFGVRCALGANAGRLARQCFVETLLLALAGGVAGIPMALWMTDSAVLLLPPMARAASLPIEMDGRVLVFALLMCLVAALASSAAAIAFVLRSDLNTILRESGRSDTGGMRSHRLRGLLVVSEIALALVVLIGAGLFFRSYRNVNAIDPGFDRSGVLLADFPMTGGPSGPNFQSFCLRLRDRLQSTAGIDAVAYADYPPLWATDGAYTSINPEGVVPRSLEELKINLNSVSPGYFALLRIPILEGRDFNAADDANAPPVMIVDQAFAKRFYAGASPLGRRVVVRKKVHTIVGMVRDSKYFSFTEKGRPHFYRPFRQTFELGQRVFFFVRANGDPESAVSTLRRAAAAVDPEMSTLNAARLAEFNALLLLPAKLAASLLAALGILAFLLAGVGLYGVMSYAVNQRTRELGIRMALGARPGEVGRMVVRDGLLLAVAGVGAGLLLALSLTRLLAGVLVGVSPSDPLTFAAATMFLVAVAALASYVPAQRATRVEPLASLRNE